MSFVRIKRFLLYLIGLTENCFFISIYSVGLGFNIKGGVDNPQVPGDSGIFVAKIREGGSAALDERLQEGDKILEVKSLSVNIFSKGCK